MAFGGARVCDHYDPDDGDATHPINIDYLIYPDATTVTKALISWHPRPFRSTVNLNPSSIGSDATGESGHSHSHAHTIPVASGILPTANQTLGAIVNTKLFNNAAADFNTAAINSDATGSSGHSHNHSHSLTGTAQQAVTDGATATVTGLLIDGVDYTATLSGPWPGGDVIALDITSVLKTAPNVWHTVTLNLSGLGRLTSYMRFYYGS